MRDKEHESEKDVRRELRKPVSPQRIARSWVAGVIDNGVRMHVMYRNDIRRTNLNFLIVCRNRRLARDVRDIIGAGKVRQDGTRWILRLTCKEVLDSLQPNIAFFSPGSVAREYIRICATWATTFHVRGFGENLPESIVTLRLRLLKELERTNRDIRAQRASDESEPYTEEDGGPPSQSAQVIDEETLDEQENDTNA